VRKSYRKGGELAMEEENVLRIEFTELSVPWLVNQLPLSIRLAAAYQEAQIV